MWLVDPKIMCQKHLCGEHLEMHMYLGAIKKGKKIRGFLKNNLFEPKKLKDRHDELATEMERRGYRHASLMLQDDYEETIKLLNEEDLCVCIDKECSLNQLVSRCPKCCQGFSQVCSEPLPASPTETQSIY
jgi:hypothetical protein